MKDCGIVWVNGRKLRRYKGAFLGSQLHRIYYCWVKTI